MAKQRCSKHPFYYEPCSICMEINKLKEGVLDRNAKTIEQEQEIYQLKESRSFAEESLTRWQRKAFDLQNEVEQLKADCRIADEGDRYYQDKICELKEEIKELEEEVHCQVVEKLDLQEELEEALNSLEKTSNLAYKSYNPEARLKLSVNDLLVVRGIFVANSFLFNSLHNIDDCITNKKDETTKEQLTLIKKDLEKEWQRVVDLLKVFAKEFSDSNWNRMIRETQKIVEVTVDTMNRRDLGHFTVGKEESLDIEYQVKPLVVKAIDNCINSAGTNNLTAYSKDLLVKELVKICEEK